MSVIINGTSGITSPAIDLTTPLAQADGGTAVSSIPAVIVTRGGSDQALSSGVSAKIQLNTEEYDTAGAFDSTTNYRFLPAVAGFYQVSGSIYFNGTTVTSGYCFINKNGASINQGEVRNNTGTDCVVGTSVLIYLDSDDYLEVFGSCNGTGSLVAKASSLTKFTAVLVRAA